VPCAPPPSHPFNIGGSPQSDWTAVNSNITRPISGAVGSFDSVTGVTSITGSLGNNPAALDIFSLQINTNYFYNATNCKSAPAPALPCFGWQQFIFSNAHASTSTQSGVLIEYFMYNYPGQCPSGWQPYAVGNGCTAFSPTTPTNKQTAADLWRLRLWAQTDGVNDRVMITNCQIVPPNAPPTGCEAHYTGSDSALGLASGWQEAEFNVFGDGGLSPIATFNKPSTLVVRVALDEGWKAEPSCKQRSFTAESNNLDLVAPPKPNQQPWPALEFMETNDPNITLIPSCAFTAGEPHLSTFDGYLYDFQATGDFLLVEAAPDFVVQTRQQRVNWPIPNVTANKAIAAKIGGTRVALCLGPTRLEVNGAEVDLPDGRSLSLPNGVNVSRNGNVYLIKGQDGETVRAAISKDDFIDVNLFLGYAPRKWVRGLLGNANGRTDDDIATRDGKVISQPISFTDLYGPYADSWRVPPDQSLLCRDNNVMSGVPDRPFYANDLDPADFKLGQETCKAAGVKAELLDACILDVGVLGQGAAEFFTRAPTPIAVMPRP
jgi:hypothetical protein